MDDDDGFDPSGVLEEVIAVGVRILILLVVIYIILDAIQLLFGVPIPGV